MAWAVFLSDGLKQVAQCVIKHTHLPEKSAQIVASTLHTFLSETKLRQAKCQQNCLALINGTDIKNIRDEYIVLREESKLLILIFLVVVGS